MDKKGVGGVLNPPSYTSDTMNPIRKNFIKFEQADTSHGRVPLSALAPAIIAALKAMWQAASRIGSATGGG